jgi:hypothetical protein
MKGNNNCVVHLRDALMIWTLLRPWRRTHTQSLNNKYYIQYHHCYINMLISHFVSKS